MAGQRVVPETLWAELAERFALIGVQGIVRMAMAGFDVACWDALAVAAGVPLAKLLGAEPRPIPAYNSCGLGLMPTDALADEAEKLLAGGFRAIKLRLGYPTLEEDIAAVHAVKQRMPAGVALMVDYNQALDVEQALARGARSTARASPGWRSRSGTTTTPAQRCSPASSNVPVQIGENFSLVGRHAGGARCQRLRSGDARSRAHRRRDRLAAAAALAAERKIKMSSHLYSETSAHLLAATPTCHFLEYMDWADKIVQRSAADRGRPRHGLRSARAAASCGTRRRSSAIACDGGVFRLIPPSDQRGDARLLRWLWNASSDCRRPGAEMQRVVMDSGVAR